MIKAKRKGKLRTATKRKSVGEREMKSSNVIITMQTPGVDEQTLDGEANTSGSPDRGPVVKKNMATRKDVHGRRK